MTDKSEQLSETEPKSTAPRKTKTTRTSASKKKKLATVTQQTVEATPVVAYSYATDVARTSHTASAMPVLDLFENRAATAPPPSVAVAFVTIPGLDEAQKKLSETLKSFMERVGGAINEAATLKVKTYVSGDIEGVKVNAQGNLEGDLRLRAMTQIELDGDIVAVIPMRPEGMDETLWAAHVDMVQQAQANRTELVKLAISAVSGLVTAIKPG